VEIRTEEAIPDFFQGFFREKVPDPLTFSSTHISRTPNGHTCVLEDHVTLLIKTVIFFMFAETKTKILASLRSDIGSKVSAQILSENFDVLDLDPETFVTETIQQVPVAFPIPTEIPDIESLKMEQDHELVRFKDSDGNIQIIFSSSPLIGTMLVRPVSDDFLVFTIEHDDETKRIGFEERFLKELKFRKRVLLEAFSKNTSKVLNFEN